MFAIRVIRHAGEGHGHTFEHKSVILRSQGEEVTFLTRKGAQGVADRLAESHAKDLFAICRKEYKVEEVT
jgi:hypothetical protein